MLSNRKQKACDDPKLSEKGPQINKNIPKTHVELMRLEFQLSERHQFFH